MSQPITLEDIFQLFERQKQETERRAAEFERSLAASKAEADRRHAEIERLIAPGGNSERTFPSGTRAGDRDRAQSPALVQRYRFHL